MKAPVGAKTELLAISHPALNSAPKLYVLFCVDFTINGKTWSCMEGADKSGGSL